MALPPLEELLTNVSQQYLNKPCKNEHLRNIARFITEWQFLASYFNLTDTDVEDVTSLSPKVQRIKLLETWKQRYGRNATYLKLAEAFFAAGRVDLVEKIQVECPHIEKGCKWTKELKDLKQHLNAAPRPGKELHGCEYVEVSCAHGCKRKFQRHSLQQHMNECLQQKREESIYKQQQEVAREIKQRRRAKRNDNTKIRRCALLAVIIVALVGIIMEKEQQKHNSDLKDLQHRHGYTSSLVYPSMCTIDGIHLPIVANKANELTVFLVNAFSSEYTGKDVNVTAKLQSDEDGYITQANVSRVETSKYRIIYIPKVHGWSKLHVKVNNSYVKGSPFRIFVQKSIESKYPTAPGELINFGERLNDRWEREVPGRLNDRRGREAPVETEGLNHPWGIAIDSNRDIYVTEFYGHQISVFDTNRRKIRTIGSEDIADGGRLMWFPTGIDIDEDDNVYVASEYKLQKFDRSGKRIRSVKSNNTMRGVRVYNDKVYVCDRDNHRILMYNLELIYIGEFFGSTGKNGFNRTHNITHNGTFDVNEPLDMDFDAVGNANVVDSVNHRIQVLNETGHIGRHFGEDKLSKPRGIRVDGDYMLVSDFW